MVILTIKCIHQIKESNLENTSTGKRHSSTVISTRLRKAAQDAKNNRTVKTLNHKVKKCSEYVTKEYLQKLGKEVKLYDGVTTWFSRINSYAEELGVKVEHYIVSSGNKEIIEGTSIAKEFKEIYGCVFEV